MIQIDEQHEGYKTSMLFEGHFISLSLICDEWKGTRDTRKEGPLYTFLRDWGNLFYRGT